MIPARQSTAITIMVGPVLDADGVAVTGGVVGDFKISKNGAAPGGLNGSATATHRHTGFYSLALTTSDTDTVGTAQITIDDTTNSCPLANLQVMEEVIYDAFYAASANTFTGAAGSTKVTGVVLVDTLTTYTGNTVQTGDSYAIVNSGTHGNAAIKGFVDDIGIAGAGLTALGDTRLGNLDAAVTTRMATYVQPTGFLAATFPSDPADQSLIIDATNAIIAAVGDVPTNAELATALGTADDAVLTAVANVQTAVNDIPTNAELATALGTADDAVLAALATAQTAINDIPTNAELATALAAADDAVLLAIGDLPTNAELATALGTADDAVLTAIAALPTAAQIGAYVITTGMGTFEASANVNSLCTLVLAAFHGTRSGGTLTIKRTDDTTTHDTKTLTTDAAAEPVVGVAE